MIKFLFKDNRFQKSVLQKNHHGILETKKLNGAIVQQIVKSSWNNIHYLDCCSKFCSTNKSKSIAKKKQKKKNNKKTEKLYSIKKVQSEKIMKMLQGQLMDSNVRCISNLNKSY